MPKGERASAPGVTWEPTTFTTSSRRGTAAALLIASAAGLLSTTAQPPRPAAAERRPAALRQAPDDRAGRAADRARRPELLIAPAVRITPPAVTPPLPAPPVAVPARAKTVQARQPHPLRAARSARTVPAVRTATWSPRRRRAAAAPASYAVAATGSVAAVIAAAMALRGTPYVWGAASSRGVDCSGLVMLAYRAVGVPLPHLAAAQAHYGRAVSYGSARPGDVLIFYGGSHAALYLGGGMMIAASKPGTPVRVTPVWDTPTAVRRIIG